MGLLTLFLIRWGELNREGIEEEGLLGLLADVVPVLPEEPPGFLGGLQILHLLRFGQVVEEVLDRGVLDRGFHGILR